MKKRHALMAVAAVVLATGCGGSDSEFRERAQAICAKYNKEIEAIERPGSLKELADTSGRIAGLIEKQLEEMRELKAPGDVADDYQRWLKLTSEAVGNANAIKQAAANGDQQRVNVLAGEAARNTLSSDRIARDMEIPGCMVEREDEGD